jgi:hypothetical protein
MYIYKCHLDNLDSFMKSLNDLHTYIHTDILSCVKWLDDIGFDNRIYCTLETRKLTATVLQIYTINPSLQHAISLLSLLCLHRLSPGNTPIAVDPSVSVFHGSSPRWLSPISQLNYALLFLALLRLKDCTSYGKTEHSTALPVVSFLRLGL